MKNCTLKHLMSRCEKIMVWKKKREIGKFMWEMKETGVCQEEVNQI